MSRALLVCFRRTGRLKKAALAQADGRIDSVRADVEGVHREIDGLGGDVKTAADAAEGAGQKVAELAEKLAHLQDRQTAMATLQGYKPLSRNSRAN